MTDPTPAVHELKTWPMYYEALRIGDKTAELRKDDRGFTVGDLLVLQEFDPDIQAYTGREIQTVITHIVSGGPWLADGYVMLSFALC